MLRFPLLSCSRFEARKLTFFLAGLTLFSAGLMGCGSGNSGLGNVPLTITAVTPATGPLTGGNTVKIVGTGFQATTAVWIWSNQAHIVKLVSSTEMDVAAPAVSAARTADVMVSASQSQFFRLDSSYTYVGSVPPAPPVPPTPPPPPPPSKAATRIVWNPASATVAVGAPIGAAQLNATAMSGQFTPVSGTFAYSPAAGTVFNSAGAQTLTVSFTPADANSFLGSTGTTVIHVVTEAVGTTTNVTSPVDSPVYGQPVSFTANVTSSKGTPQGTVTFLDGQTSLGTGTLTGGVASINTAALNAGAHNITGAYSGDSLHTGSTGSVRKSIGPAQVEVTWSPTPATLKVGAPLGAGQLDALAATQRLSSVPGSFTYSPAAGTAFRTPGPQTLNVTFTPRNTNFTGATAQAVINVTSSVVGTGTTVASSAPNSAYGQPVTFTATVSAGNGNATGTVAFLDGQTPLGSGVVSNGAATFSTAAFTTGVHNISAAYSGDANNTASNGSTVQNVNKAQAAISWFPNPATVIVGTALGAGQLDATASSKSISSVPGSFAYAPAAGTTFNTTGPQILNVVFTPADSVNFLGATATAQINVESSISKSTTAVSSATPNSIYGQSVTFTANVTASTGTPTGSVLFSDGQTALGSAALNNGAATFATSALTAGAHSITATYSGDSVNGSSSASTTQNVGKAAVTIAWSPSPSTINVGAALGAGQLDATAGNKSQGAVAGTFVYLPAAGTTFNAAGPQSLGVTFTPADAADFSGATGSATITVASTTSTTTTTVTSSAPTSSYGQTVVLTAAVASGTGTPTGSVSFTDGATVLGTGTLANGAASISTSALATGAHTITAAYGGDTTHTGSSASATQTVSQAQVTIAWTPKPSSISVGAALGAGQLDAIASTRNAASVSGTMVYSPAAGTSFSSPGSQTLSATFTPDDAVNFSGATGSAVIKITSNIAQSTTAVASSAPNSSPGQSVTFTATVTSTGGTPTGSVSFMDSAAMLGTGNLNGGGTAAFSTTGLNPGKHNISAVYAGDANTAGSTGSLTQNVSAGAGNYVFVDARGGSDSNPGSQSAPYRTIGAAVSKALSNNVRGVSTSVQIGPGVYREYVNIYPTGGQTSAQMTFEAVTPGTAIIAGSDVVSNWQAVNSTEYVHSWSNSLPGCGIPSQWPNLPKIILNNQMVFVDGNPMTQILSPADQQPGTFYEDSSQIHIWPPAGTDMSAATIEVSARAETLQINSRNNIVLRGLVFEHAGSCINSSGTNVFSSNNILLDQVQANWNNWGGIQVSFGDSVTVQNSSAYHNGGVGIGAWRNTNITLQNDETAYNNWRGAMASFYDFGMGGTKMMLTHGGQVLNLHSYRNQGQGLWFDTDNKNISVDSAALSENMIADLKLEANQGPFTVTNSSFCSSGAGILISNTERLTATGNNFYNNGGSTTTIWEASVFLGGTPGGRPFTDWQTGAAMRTFATNTTLTNNTYVDAGGGQNVFGTFSSGSFWNNFVNTFHSNQNTFYDANTKTPFLDPAGHRDNLNGWQNATGQDSGSTWAQPGNAAQNCTPPPTSYPDFNLEANNRENAPQDVGVAPYYMSGGSVSIPIQVQSFNGGAVTLSMSALPSGVSASFSPATLTAGNTVLTLRASGGAATETIPITVIATSGNRVHTMTVLAGIAP